MAKDLVEILPDYSDKVGNLTQRVLAARDAESAHYSHYMAKMLAATDAQREENKKLAEIRKIRHGIDPHAQQPSTQAILARPKEEDEAHFFRPLPPELIEKSKQIFAAIDAGDMEAVKKFVAERPLTAAEVIPYKTMQRASKNTLGESQESSVSEEKKGLAIDAFMYSPGVTVDESMLPYKTSKAVEVIEHMDEEPAPKNVASRLFHWLWKRGVPIDKLTKKELEVEKADE